MKKSISIFLFLIIISSNLFSQVTQEWVKRYNGPGNFWDNANNIVVDDFGNIYVTGSSPSDTTYQSSDFCTIKYNSQGVQLWTARYDGPAHLQDGGLRLCLDNLNNIIVAGYSKGIGSGNDYCLIKYNSEGSLIWISRYNGPGNGEDIPRSLTLDDDNNIYVTGESDGGSNGRNYCTIKYNTNGDLIWVSRYLGPNNWDQPSCLVLFDKNNIYVTGVSTNLSPFGYTDYCTIKYDSSGSEKWIARYRISPNSYNYASSLALDNFGNLYVTGNVGGNTSSSKDFCTIKYNPNGLEKWVRIYNSPENGGDGGSVIAVDKRSNIYVGGSRYGNGINAGDFCLIKYDTAGLQKWVASYNGPAHDIDNIISMALDTFGNIYVTGNSAGIGSSTDFCTIKYDSSGTEKWNIRYNGPGNVQDRVSSIAVDKNGIVCITGLSYGGVSRDDYCTIMYSQAIGIQPISSEVPDNFSLSQNYPNPFNPVTKIKFSIPPSRGARGMTRLIIYDILGREVTMLVNEQLKPGTYEVEWDGSNFPSGVYFYTLKTEQFRETKRMVLLK